MRPLIATRITANHLTTARLIIGLGAGLAFATGLRSIEVWGGVLWVLSAFLDCADGELARAQGKTSAIGHRFDLICDIIVNSTVFLAIGVGQRDSLLGYHAITLGVIASGSIGLASTWSERLEQHLGNGEKAYTGWGPFDFDDVLYLFGPIAWLGWLLPLLIGAAVGGSVFALATWIRLRLARPGKTRQAATDA